MLIGTIQQIWRYPVKSMAGERLDAADVDWHGVAGDRRWAFVRPGLERSGFPWLTIREHPRMREYVPVLADPAHPDRTGTVVRTPTGAELDVADPALAAELGEGVRVIRQNVGVFDSQPVSLLTTQSIASLSALTGRALDVQRFRPNVLVEATGGEAFAEDAWVGATLRIGGARLRADLRDERCVLVNVDPQTHERDASVLRAIAQERGACLGVYGTTVTPGRVAVGDDVVLEVS